MKNTIITIAIVLVIIGTVFIALVKFDIIEFGHHEGDGHDHSTDNDKKTHYEGDGHDHSTDNDKKTHYEGDGHDH